MANAAIVTENLADSGLLTASSEVAGMEVTELRNPNVTDDLWRSDGNSENVTLDLAGNQTLDSVAVFGLNLTATATIRARVSTSAGGATSGDLHDHTYTVADAQFDPDYAAFVLLLPASVSARFVRLDIVDAALGFLEAGRLVVGARTALEFNFAPGSHFDWQDSSVVQKSKGQQTLIWQRPSFRTASIDIPWVSNAQRWGLIETMGRVNGRHSDILMVLDAGADNLPQWTIWGLLTDMQPSAFTAIPDLYSKQLQIEERR